MAANPQHPRNAICLSNDGYPASRKLRKLYEVIADANAAAEELVRVVDESGEDYLYPADFFYPLEVTSDLEAVLRRR